MCPARRHRRDQRAPGAATDGGTAGHRRQAATDDCLLALSQPGNGAPLAVQPTNSKMNVYVSSFQTTFGPFSVAVCEDESIVATAFGDAAALEPYLGGCHVMRDIGKTRAARE